MVQPARGVLLAQVLLEVSFDSAHRIADGQSPVHLHEMPGAVL